jgi:type I restriction enzyme S subunit
MNLGKYYTGATIPHIYFKDYQDEPLMLPSMEEQEEIVSVLDKLDQLVEQRKQQLSKLDELVKARFVEMFGDLASPNCRWNTEKMSDTCESSDDIKCGPFGTQLSKDEYKDSGVAVWEIPQINSLFLTMPTHFLTEEKAKQLDAYSIKPGDIAMSRKGNVGKCAVFPSTLKAGIIHSDVLRIRVDNSRVLPLFMMHQLHYSGAVQHQIELVSSGAIMAGINVTKLKQIFVHVPPLELQNQFVAFVEKNEKTKSKIQKSLEKLETLKKALMQKYFG